LTVTTARASSAGRMIGEDLRHQLDPPCRGHVRQPNQAGMRFCADVDQRSEIGIDRDQNAALVGGQAEQCRIPRIAPQGSDFQDVVPLAAQPRRQPATDAAVNEESQTGVTRTA
jgi:hypothetical protein